MNTIRHQLASPLQLVVLATAGIILLPLGYVTAQALTADPAVWSRLWATRIPELLFNTISLAVAVGAVAAAVGGLVALLIDIPRAAGASALGGLAAVEAFGVDETLALQRIPLELVRALPPILDGRLELDAIVAVLDLPEGLRLLLDPTRVTRAALAAGINGRSSYENTKGRVRPAFLFAFHS